MSTNGLQAYIVTVDSLGAFWLKPGFRKAVGPLGGSFSERECNVSWHSESDQQWGLSTGGEHWEEGPGIKIGRPVWLNCVMLGPKAHPPREVMAGQMGPFFSSLWQRLGRRVVLWWTSVIQQSGVREMVSVQLGRVSAVTVVGFLVTMMIWNEQESQIPGLVEGTLADLFCMDRGRSWFMFIYQSPWRCLENLGENLLRDCSSW